MKAQPSSESIHAILSAWERGEKVKVPYHRGMGVKWARAYYSQQPEILCAVVGHKISGIIGDDAYCECFRCGNKFKFHGNISLCEFLWLLPKWKVKQWILNLILNLKRGFQSHL